MHTAIRVLTPRQQDVYFVVMKFLHRIGCHPIRVSEGALGYFMSIDDIKEGIGTFDPIEWYTDSFCEGKHLAFTELPEEDQQKIQQVLKELVASRNQRQLEESCLECYKLAGLFADKILALQPEAKEEAA